MERVVFNYSDQKKIEQPPTKIEEDSEPSVETKKKKVKVIEDADVSDLSPIDDYDDNGAEYSGGEGGVLDDY